MYQLLDRGEPVPCTRCDTIEEMIKCVQAFEDVHKDMYPDKWDLSPYTIGVVKS
jgi:hypothetical protein